MAQDEPRHGTAPKKSESDSPVRAMIPYSYVNDEIDLIGIGASLWRRWKMMLAVFLGCLGLTLLAVFLIPKDYQYSTTVQVGTQIVGNQVQPVEPPDSAAKKVENGFLPEIIQQYAQKNTIPPKKLKFIVSSPLKTNLVVISGKATDSLAKAYISIENEAAQRLVQSELPLTKVMRAKLESKLVDAQSNLQELQNPKYKALLHKQIASLETYQALVRKEQLQANRKSNSANEALSAMLLSNQAQDANKQLSELEQTLEINLPGQIASAKAEVSSLKTEINNLQTSKVVAGPLKSVEPTGPSRTFTVILGVTIGLILALFAAACANYISAVRSRLKETNSSPHARS